MSDLDMPPPSYAAAIGAPVASSETNQYSHHAQLPTAPPSAPLCGDEKQSMPQQISQAMPQPISQPISQPMPQHAYNPYIHNPTPETTATTNVTSGQMSTDECTPKVFLGYFLIFTITTLLMGFAALGAMHRISIYIIMPIIILGFVLIFYIAHKFVNKWQSWNWHTGYRRRRRRRRRRRHF